MCERTADSVASAASFQAREASSAATLPHFIQLVIQRNKKQLERELSAVRPASVLTDHISAKDEEGRCALHHACAYNEADLLELLLTAVSQNTNLDELNDLSDDWLLAGSRRHTLLHICALSSAHLCLKILLSDDMARLRHWFPIDARNSWGETALHLAAACGDAQSAAEILSQGGSALVTDRWGETPAGAARSHQNNREFVELLQEFEICDRRIAISKDNPSDCAARAAAVLRLRAFASSERQRSGDSEGDGNTDQTRTLPVRMPRRVLSRMMEAPLDDAEFASWIEDEALVDLWGRDYYGYSALDKLCSWNKHECLERLITLAVERHDVSPKSTKNSLLLDVLERPGPGGNTPLHLAVESGAELTALKLCDLCVGSSVLSVRNDDGQTPLHLAVSSGQKNVVAKLVSAGARAIDPNSAGLHALHLAQNIPDHAVKEHIIELLLAAVTEPAPVDQETHLVEDGSIRDSWLRYLNAWHADCQKTASQTARSRGRIQRKKIDASKFASLESALSRQDSKQSE